MIPVDFHSHTLYSLCGLHTHIEMLCRARDLGMAGLAITDHGSEIGGRIPSSFFDRLCDPVPGVRLIKGIECNVRGLTGEIDVPRSFLSFLDIVLLGLHPNTPRGLGVEANTRLLIDAMDQNPCVDLITHPVDAAYPVAPDALARAAAARGVAIELNNSKLHLVRIDPAPVRALIRACRAAGCRMAVCSDAHVVNEIGRDHEAQRLLAHERFPSELRVNDTAEKAFAFLAERRPAKTASAGTGYSPDLPSSRPG